ncbi:hypothetical protein [Halospina denitrificans]|nr:hypothetical protein [Halospina denitrificans]
MSDERNEQQPDNWWLGVADIVTVGLEHSVLTIERVHLSIADESFDVLSRIPVTQPVSEPVRVLHHRISSLCYRSVSVAAGTLNRHLRK